MTEAQALSLDPWLSRWCLTPDGAAFTTHHARLMPVRQAGRPAMLKLTAQPDEIRGGAVMVWWAGSGAAPVLVVSNFTPIARQDRRIGVPAAGRWAERLNTDATVYAGSGQGNLGGKDSDPLTASGRPDSICITLPPLSTIFFELVTD